MADQRTIYRSTAPGLPVAAYDDFPAFKIYLVDVGLLRRLAQLAPTVFAMLARQPHDLGRRDVQSRPPDRSRQKSRRYFA